LTTGVTATGYARSLKGTSISLAQETYSFSDTYPLVLEASLRVATLPTGTETFSADVGFRTTLNASNANALFGIRWDAGSSSAKWVGFTRTTAGATTTTVSTLASPAANTWYRVRIVLRATDVKCYVLIAGVWTLAVTISTTMPDAGVSQYISCVKSVGTTSRTADFDYVWVYQEFASGRPA
jgi:hypothetical protein